MPHTQLALAATLAPLVAFTIAIIGFRRRHAIAASIVLLVLPHSGAWLNRASARCRPLPDTWLVPTLTDTRFALAPP